MSTILSVLAALVLISILVTVHELGHFLVGRRLGFKILEFAVGMGPVLLKKEKKGIEYSLRALPVGGMCRFYGEDSAETDGANFSAHPAWKKILVIVAGPLMNLLLALLLSTATLIIYGNYMPAVYELTAPDMPAAVGGMLPGDVIVAVNGKSVHEYSEAVPLIQKSPDGQMTVTVDRGGKRIDCVLTDCFDETLGYNLVGITVGAQRVRYGLFRSIGESAHYMGTVIGQIFDFFGTLFKGKVTSTDVAGPVGTIAYVSQAVRYGPEMILRFAMLISVSLGIFNLLPIPALDGGRLAFLLFEAVSGKKVDPEKEGMVHFVGLIVLFGLILFLTYNDIANLVRH